MYDDVCVSVRVYISIHMSFSTKERLCSHVIPAVIRHVAIVYCALSPVFTLICGSVYVVYIIYILFYHLILFSCFYQDGSHTA